MPGLVHRVALPPVGVGDGNKYRTWLQQGVEEFRTEPGDLCLGRKEFTFRLHSHDPRQMDLYRDRWKEHEGRDGWRYDRAAMDLDLFYHRIGAHPNLRELLQLIPVGDEGRIPADGHELQGSIIPMDEWDLEDDVLSPEGVPCETEAILLDRQAVSILQAIAEVEWRFGMKHNGPLWLPQGHFERIGGSLGATWDERAGQGVRVSFLLLSLDASLLGTRSADIVAHLRLCVLCLPLRRFRCKLCRSTLFAGPRSPNRTTVPPP